MLMSNLPSLCRTAAVGALILSRVAEGLPHGLFDRANDHASHNSHWVDIWTSMPQLTEPANLPDPPFVSTRRLMIS